MQTNKISKQDIARQIISFFYEVKFKLLNEFKIEKKEKEEMICVVRTLVRYWDDDFFVAIKELLQLKDKLQSFPDFELTLNLIIICKQKYLSVLLEDFKSIIVEWNKRDFSMHYSECIRDFSEQYKSVGYCKFHHIS